MLEGDEEKPVQSDKIATDLRHLRFSDESSQVRTAV